MKDSQLLRTLKFFSSSQWDEFDKFLRSPYFNDEIEKGISNAYLLFCHIRKFKDDFQSPKLIKDNATQLIFANDQVKGKMDKTMSSLLKFIKSFLVVSTKNKSNLPSLEFPLLDFYSSNNWSEKFETEAGKSVEAINSATIQDESFLLEKLLLEKRIHEHENINNKRVGDLNLSKTLEALDNFYLVSKLKYSALLEQQKKFIDIAGKQKIELGDVISNLENDHLSPLLAVAYQKAIKIIQSGHKDEHLPFYSFRQFLAENEAYIPTIDLRNLHSFLRNYCTSAYNKGDNTFLPILFDIYKEQIEKGILYTNEFILHTTFTNIVVAGLKLGEFVWVEQFIRENKNKIIGAKNEHEVFDLNLANYYFHVKEYDKAWNLLEGNYEDLYYKLMAKRLEVKILFENQESDILDAKINAFKVYISRTSSKIIYPTIKAMNNAFINYLSQIINPSTLHNPERIRKIQQKIIAQKAVAEREWLLEKIEELLKK